MWWTAMGERVLEGAEAELVRCLLGTMVNSLLELPKKPLHYGIPHFDDLGASQQLALLAAVGEALFYPEIPAPELNAVNESAIAAIFQELEIFVEAEVEVSRELAELQSRGRQLILDVIKLDIEGESKEPGKSIDLQDSFDDLPDADSNDLCEWKLLIEIIAGRILWDQDYLEDFGFDDCPAKSRRLKRTLDIHEDYYVSLAPDPKDEEMPEILTRLKRLTNTQVYDPSGKPLQC